MSHARISGRSWIAAIVGGSLVALPARLLAQPESGPPAAGPDQDLPSVDDSSDVQVPNQDVPEGWEDQLAPYGNWIEVPGYGWCWQPSETVVGSDFRPYLTGGGWDYTADGWVFDSPWSWGALTFHYGRWFDAPGYGWCWIPGTEWAPSWVDWRVGDGYIGWAPLAPPGYRWRGGHHDQWAFVHGNGFVGGGCRVGWWPRTTYRRSSPPRERRRIHGL